MGIDFSKLPLTGLPKESIWKNADKLRQDFWGDMIPVDVDIIVERGLGIELIPIPDLKQFAGTEAFLSGDLQEIDYDPSALDVRIRFSIAHEIGHYVLHKAVISKLRTVTFEEWKEMQFAMPIWFWGKAEWQAREFAGRLLVPRERLLKEIHSLHGNIEEAKHSLPDLTQEIIVEYITPTLGKTFKVSADVISRRISSEEIKLL